MAEARNDQGDQQRLLPSVDDSRPTEQGGVVARQGFNYQDEVAIGFLIDLIENPVLEKIHCETHDDIVLVFSGNGSSVKCAEYVQVKGGELDQLWTPAKLCERKGTRAGTSIFEKSFEKDRHCEISRFRIVTLRPVSAELKVLTQKPGSHERQSHTEEISALSQNLNRRFPGLTSNKNNGVKFWLENCFWDERHNEQAVQDANRLRLLRLSAQQDKPLLPEQVDGLLNELRTMAKGAASARWDDGRDKKVITKNQIQSWWERRTTEITQGAMLPAGGKLRSKMEDANIPDDQINSAVNLRMKYSSEARTSKYMEPEESERLVSKVQTEVHVLRARHVSGQLAMDGKEFHFACVDKMTTINDERPSGSESKTEYLLGCMYDMADRCLLRFEEPT